MTTENEVAYAIVGQMLSEAGFGLLYVISGALVLFIIYVLVDELIKFFHGQR